MMFLSRRITPVTVPLVHWISSQSHGEDEKFQDWMEGGSLHCRLRFSRMSRSALSDCEFTWRGTETTRRRRRKRRSGVLGNGRDSLVILRSFCSVLRLGMVPGKGGKPTVNIQTWGTEEGLASRSSCNCAYKATLI